MSFLRRLNFLLRRRSAETDMAEEMRFHLEQRTARLRAQGLDEPEARLDAQRRFGNTASLQEQAREAWGWGGVNRFAKDLRLGARTLRKSPGFTVLAILTLSLGIGATTGMFGMVQTILYKPLPYPDGAAVVRVYRATPQSRSGHISPADFLAFRNAHPELGEVAAYAPANASLSEPGQPADLAYAARVSASLLPLLGLPPQIGRTFRPDEETPGLDRVVILSHRVWLRRFQGDPQIINRLIRVDGEPHRIVGVMPESFNDWRHLGMIDFFRPLSFRADEAAERGVATIRILVRPAPGRSAADVADVVADFGRRLAQQFPEANAGSSWRAEPLPETITGKSARPMFGMMLALSVFVLLIACSNLANLMLARTMARAREFAVRGALGASRVQLLRPLATESLLLSLLGGAGAVLVAYWFRDYIAARSTGDNGEGVVMEIGWPLFSWAVLASLITAVGFGLAPALFALRLDLNATLKSGGRGAVGGRGHQRFRQILIVGQFAIAITLLAAAGVQIRGLHELNSRRVGWASENLVTGTMLLPAATYPDAGRISAFHRLALERLAAIPGVDQACLSSHAPFSVWPGSRKFVVEGRDRPEPGREPAAVVNPVSSGYFAVYGTRLLAGRVFDERDTAQSPPVFIVSELTARSLFGPDADPIGRRLAELENGEPRWGEVVGVVADVEPAVLDLNLVSNQVYRPIAQEPSAQNQLAVRTTGVTPVALVESIRETMAQLDPDLPIRRLQPAELTVERSNYQVAVGRDLFSGMAGIGVALAALGIYGVITRTMAQRTGEFAIRLALGAGLGHINRLVLATGLRLALTGSLLGLVGGYAVSHFLAAQNPTMRTQSTEVLAASTLLLVAVALLACWLPARRARKVDPMAALRAE